MKRGGLRTYGLPFDYMFAFPCYIKRSLDVDFTDWLDPQYLEAVYREADGYYGTIHSMYDEHTSVMRKNDPSQLYAFFNHHNLLSDEHKEKFQRRIERYRNIVNSDNHIVLITNSWPERFKSVGLDKYYSDRNGGATIVYLKRTGPGEDSVNIQKIEDYYVVNYTSDTVSSEAISKMICDEIVRVFEA